MNYFLIAGYGWTGSSALVDMLKEYDGCYEADVEFRLIKDSKGIADLYQSIISKWDALNVDIAIREFLWFTSHLYAKKSKASLYGGLGYRDYFGTNFLMATQDFIGNIVEFDYESYWWYLDFLKTPYQVLQRKLLKVLGRDSHSTMRFSSIDDAQFIKFAQDYIDSIFLPVVAGRDVRNIILDQAVSAQNCLVEKIFVPNAKVVIVERDPRDIYADLMKDGSLIGRELQNTHDTMKYIKWHKALRKNIQATKDCAEVLSIYFEDLIMNYDNTERRVEEFLGLNSTSHTRRRQIFNPTISGKNMGIWKDKLNAAERNEIETNLKEYLIQ